MTETVPDDRERRVRELYAAFNRRDVDAVLAGLHPDVVWANGMSGGYVHGHDGVRDYWTSQFTQIRPTVEPTRVGLAPDGRTAVEVHQVVRSVDGSQLLTETTVRHLYTFDESGLVTRFDIA